MCTGLDHYAYHSQQKLERAWQAETDEEALLIVQGAYTFTQSISAGDK